MDRHWKVVVTDCETTELPIEAEAVERIGGRLVVGSCRTEEDVIALARDADAILYDYAPITAPVISELERCRVIVRYGVGLDRIDLEAAAARGIEVRSLPGWSAEEVSDHAVALVFALARTLLPLDRWVREGGWGYAGELNTRLVAGKRIGIVGFGAIGRRVAAKARGVGMDVVVCDPFVDPAALRAAQTEPVALEELLETADFVSLHLPLNDKTAGIIGPEELARMKPEAYLINCARGGIVDEPALIEALQSGRLAGAGLDVFADEPPQPDNPLFAIDSVVLTPHAACYSETSMDDMHRMAVGHVVDVLTAGDG